MSVSQTSHFETLKGHYVVRNLTGFFGLLWGDWLSRLAILYLLLVCALAVVGPHITPYEYDAQVTGEDGRISQLAEPSLQHPLGTTFVGYDVFSRVIYGARPTVITGAIGGFLIASIGVSIGLTAGYMGGKVDRVLMAITDVAYGVPLIPFAVVLLSFAGFSFLAGILIIGLLLWRSIARVIRAQVLQIKERPFILAAKTTGASDARIIVKHVLPNVAPMSFLFLAIGVGTALLVQAGLVFIGVSSPLVPSWGIMMRNVFNKGYMAQAMWWSLPPGILLSLTVLSLFVLGRRYEELASLDRDPDVMEG